MSYNYAVFYTVESEEGNCESGVLGIRYHKRCNNSMLKVFIKKMIPCAKKAASIIVNEIEDISEEESLKRFGNKLFCPNRIIY